MRRRAPPTLNSPVNPEPRAVDAMTCLNAGTSSAQAFSDSVDRTISCHAFRRAAFRMLTKG
eukprot:1323337-Rhodomonas_salina.1